MTHMSMCIDSGISETKSQNVSCAERRLRHRVVRLGLHGVHQVRETSSHPG